MNVMISSTRSPKNQKKEIIISLGDKYTTHTNFEPKNTIAKISETEEEIANDNLNFKIPSKRRAILNVGGERHEILWKHLLRLPHTRLGRLRHAKTIEEILNLCDNYNEITNEYFFNRHPRSFNMILNFYRTGKLHLIENVCSSELKEDLLYWGIREFYIEVCCQQKYYEGKDDILDEIIQDNEKMLKEKKEMKFTNCYPTIREKIWSLLEDPKSSIFARAITVISIFFIILSVIALVINTLPEFQLKLNISNLNENQSSAKHSKIKTEIIHEGGDLMIFEIIEGICIGWFTIEYLFRCWASPNKKIFFKGILNFIDLVSLIPYFIGVLFSHGKYFNTENLNDFRRILQVFRILRILRVFKLARHSTGLIALGYTFKKSYKELGMLVLFLTVAVLLFSSLVYYTEHEVDETKFTSVFASFWWTIISMTTVGFGDIYPQTVLGKLIGVFCCIFGVLVISLPVPIIASNFNRFFEKHKRIEKLKKEKEIEDSFNVNIIQLLYM